MGNWGAVDYSEFEKFYKKLEKLGSNERQEVFIRDCCRELAARLLQKVILRTPVGDYSEYAEGYQIDGGTLRRGWTGGREMDGREYAQILPISKRGNEFVIEVKNTVNYASYVEFGHKQKPGRYVPAIGKTLKASWVKGKFFLTISEDELKTTARPILEKKLNAELRRVLGD